MEYPRNYIFLYMLFFLFIFIPTFLNLFFSFLSWFYFIFGPDANAISIAPNIFSIVFYIFIPYSVLVCFIKPVGALIIGTSLTLAIYGHLMTSCLQIFVKILIPANEGNATSTFRIRYESEQILWFIPYLNLWQRLVSLQAKY